MKRVVLLLITSLENARILEDIYHLHPQSQEQGKQENSDKQVSLLLTMKMEEIRPFEILGSSKLLCYNWEEPSMDTVVRTSTPAHYVYFLRPLKILISILTKFYVPFSFSDEASKNCRSLITVYNKMVSTMWEVSITTYEADTKVKAYHRNFKISRNSTEPYPWLVKFRFQKW